MAGKVAPGLHILKHCVLHKTLWDQKSEEGHQKKASVEKLSEMRSKRSQMTR